MNRVQVSGSLLAAAGVMIAGGGCTSGDPAFDSIRSNPSPELVGVASRSVDIDRNTALVSDQNLRMMTDDLNRLFLFDSPSVLSPWNIVSTTGQP